MGAEAEGEGQGTLGCRRQDARTTICGSDLHIVKGHVPTVTDGRILGHEGVGLVDEVGPAVSSSKKGRPGPHLLPTSCGRCAACREGMYSHVPVRLSVMVWIEAPLSGASTNPARTLGRGLVAEAMDGWWVYWLGPLLGTLAGVAIQAAPWARSLEIRVAKVFHFQHDPFGVFAQTSATTDPKWRRDGR